MVPPELHYLHVVYHCSNFKLTNKIKPQYTNMMAVVACTIPAFTIQYHRICLKRFVWIYINNSRKSLKKKNLEVNKFFFNEVKSVNFTYVNRVAYSFHSYICKHKDLSFHKKVNLKNCALFLPCNRHTLWLCTWP